MSDILCPTIDHLLVSGGPTDDRFIADNMLTDQDLDLELDPCLWTDLLSNDSSSESSIDQLMSDHLMADTIGGSTCQTSMIGLQTPDTPPSSDRSTPPNFDDLLSPSSIVHSPPPSRDHYTRHLFIQTNGTPLQPSQPAVPANSVTLIPAINLCSTLSPILANSGHTNAAPIVTIKPETNEMIVINNQLNTNILNAGNNCAAAISPTIVTTNSNGRIDLSQQRREARKVRNREAANISRKRQKEYVQSLERSINGLIKDNTDLKSDNELLRQKLVAIENKFNSITGKAYNYMEGTCSQCRQRLFGTNFGSNKKATLSLLAVIFMLGLNLAPFGGISITNDRTLQSIDTNSGADAAIKHGPSRALLWNNDNSLDIDVIAFNSSARNGSAYSDCKSYINQTESRRLATDLRYWVSRVELEKEEVFQHKRRVKAKENQMKNRFDKPIPLSRLKAWIQKRTETDFNDFYYDSNVDSNYRKNLKVPQIALDDLLSAIPRRSDTFYLFSYSSKDHLIIPPIGHNESANNGNDIRPRFSLLMPLISTLNESTIRGTNITYNQISIMQIDCHVINTKMVLFNSKRGDKSSGIFTASPTSGQPSVAALKNSTKQLRLNSRNKTSMDTKSANNSMRN